MPAASDQAGLRCVVLCSHLVELVSISETTGPPRCDVLQGPVLLLNRYYVPVCTTTVRRGIVLLYAGNAQVLDAEGATYDFARWRQLPVVNGDPGIPTVDSTLRVPRVLQLLGFDRMPKTRIRLSRRNLLLRDDHQCQYCGVRPGVRHLNVDHVRPRSRGGPHSWDNLVISCRNCNLRKGQRTPEEAGMKLVRKPQRPRWSPTAHILMSHQRPLDEWQPFLLAG